MSELTSEEMLQRLIPAPWYSKDGEYVFQNTNLGELVRKKGKDAAKAQLEENLPGLLKITEKFYQSELSTAHNKDYYGTALDFTRKAMEAYEKGEGKILMFYGNYRDGSKESSRIILVFENPQ